MANTSFVRMFMVLLYDLAWVRGYPILLNSVGKKANNSVHGTFGFPLGWMVLDFLGTHDHAQRNYFGQISESCDRAICVCIWSSACTLH